MFNTNDFVQAIKQLEKYKSDSLVLATHTENFDLLDNARYEIEEATGREVTIIPSDHIRKDKVLVLNGGVCEVRDV